MDFGFLNGFSHEETPPDFVLQMHDSVDVLQPGNSTRI